MIGCDIWLIKSSENHKKQNQNAFCFISFVFVLPLLFFFLLKSISVHGCSSYMYVCVLCVLHLLFTEAVRGHIRFPGTRVAYSFEPL